MFAAPTCLNLSSLDMSQRGLRDYVTKLSQMDAERLAGSDDAKQAVKDAVNQRKPTE